MSNTTRMEFKLASTLAHHVLSDPFKFIWSVQGFGMLRAYLNEDKSMRLHIWNGDLRVPGVSDIHSHPWDFYSLVVCGSLHNERFAKSAGKDFQCALITPGENASVDPAGVTSTDLTQVNYEILHQGDAYKQAFYEIHRTLYSDGTVTIVKRDRGDREDKAYLFWKAGTSWVNARPRFATREEVLATLAKVKL